MDEQFEPEVYEMRWAKVQEHLEKEEQDIFIVSSPANLRYLSCAHIPSFPLLTYIIVERDGPVTGIASSLEKYRAMEEAHIDQLKIFSPYPGIPGDGKKPLETLKTHIRGTGAENALCDSKLQTRIVKQRADGLVEKMRMVKDARELDIIRTACGITDAAAAQLEDFIVEGVTERSAANHLNRILRSDERVQTTAFETIVAGGPNAAFSHHDITRRKFRKHDPVIVDFGVYVNGYCSDCTRTLFVGEPTSEMADVYELVLEGQEKAIDMCREGLEYGHIDRSIRDLFRETGHHVNFVHSTGHGIGLEVHEAPNGIRFNMKNKMQDGHVFTVEPGIYLPGIGGVRIEDDILMENGVSTPLTHSKKTL